MKALLAIVTRYRESPVKPAHTHLSHLCEEDSQQAQRCSDQNLPPKETTHERLSWAFRRGKSNMRRFLLYTLSAAITLIILRNWLPGASLTIPAVYEQARSNSSALSSRGSVHPIQQLSRRAAYDFGSCNASQSTSLSEAVAKYRHRYGIPPPPQFDKWYNFAVSRGAQLVDEYDTINDSLRLFWSVPPQQLRARAAWLLAHRDDLSLMGVSLRRGQVMVRGSGQGEYQHTATREMISKFSEWLPDMDLVFNVNDEPRVLVPWEDASRMENIVAIGRTNARAVLQAFTLTNSTGLACEDIQFTRLEQQNTWPQVKYSCPIDTPARAFCSNGTDETAIFPFQGVRFVTDVGLQSDMCLRPSLRDTIGLLASPNALSITKDLVPILSPSKLSPFADILYPSPYYYAEKVKYDVDLEDEVPWENRTAQLYWHGATSGGYSSDGQWRSFLRQSIVSRLTLPDPAAAIHVLELSNTSLFWEAATEGAQQASERYDILFTEIKQCSPQDCADMLQHFGRHPSTPQTDTWKFKYLLGVDGNALSGRFPSSLASGSVVMKVAFFREWWNDRMFPWRDYVPLTETVNEVPELLRYFENDAEGQQIARKFAENGRRAADERLRKEDMEIYMFRLLLEYTFHTIAPTPTHRRPELTN
jgi:hypothetical protein